MNRRIVAAALLLGLSACQRELELPAEPAAVPPPPAERPEPALLGKLAGDYELTVVLEVGGGIGVAGGGAQGGGAPGIPGGMGGGAEASAGFLRLMHLVDPKAVEPERVIAFAYLMTVMNAGGPLSDQAQTCGTMIDGTFDGSTVTGDAQDYLCDGTIGERKPFEATPVAGLAAFGSNLTYKVCAESEPREVRGRRRCQFNAAISGVYQGIARGCGSRVEEEVQLALGFNGQEVSGFTYPWGTEIISGSYDPFAFGGTLTFQDRTTYAVRACASFTLLEDGDELVLELQELDADGTGTCDFAATGCTGRRIEASRLAGGAPEDCTGFAGAQALYVQPQITEQGGQRFLDVTAFSPDGSGGVLPPQDVEVIVTPAAGGEPAPQLSSPEGVTARFLLGDDCSSETRSYELFARSSGFDGSSQGVAAISCVVDTPTQGGGAVDGAECFEPGTRQGLLTCAPLPDDGDLFTPERYVWVAYCESSSSCTDPAARCLAATGDPRCGPNFCGALATNGPGTNGELWEPCDSFDGGIERDELVLEGLCLPIPDGAGGTVPICLMGGQLPPGSPCKPTGVRAPEALCMAGSACQLERAPPPVPTPCACDPDCAAEPVPSSCDRATKSCTPLGSCRELCDAASAALREPGTVQACDDPGAACGELVPGSAALPTVVGACVP